MIAFGFSPNSFYDQIYSYFVCKHRGTGLVETACFFKAMISANR